MNAIHLVNNQTSEVIYQPLRQELIVKLKGIVTASQLGIIRSLVVQFFGNLNASTFVLDLENSEYQEFDFEDTEHKQFYKTAEKQGVKNFLLKYPNKYFHDQLKKQWKVFFEKNQIQIQVHSF